MSDIVGGIIFSFSVLLFLAVITERLGFHTLFKSLFKIDHAPLFKIKLFWVASLFPLVIALVLSIPMLWSTEFEFTSKGYSTFVELFSFPLWITSGSIIFGVLVGRFHGSVQRYEALSQTENNNNFRNYIEHKKLFFEKIDFDGITFRARLTQENEGATLNLIDIDLDFHLNKERLYDFFFPDNSYKRFDISKRNSFLGVSELNIKDDAKEVDKKAFELVESLTDITGVSLHKGLHTEQFWSHDNTSYPYKDTYLNIANLQCLYLVLGYLDDLVSPLSDSSLSSYSEESELLLIKPFSPCEMEFSLINCYIQAETNNLAQALRNRAFVTSHKG